LSPDEIIENINVAEDDALLYEVKIAMPSLEQNNYFPFIPRKQIEKQRQKRAQEVLKAVGVKFDESAENGEEQLMLMPLEKYID
jgi:hypothetical protein